MDENQPLVTEAQAQADVPVTAPEVTATSESAQNEQPAKTFSQEEVDALVAKRLAKEQREAIGIARYRAPSDLVPQLVVGAVVQV